MRQQLTIGTSSESGKVPSSTSDGTEDDGVDAV